MRHLLCFFAGRIQDTALGVRPDYAEGRDLTAFDYVFGAIPIQKQTDQGGVDTVPLETTTQRTKRSSGFVAPGAESSTYVPVATSATASRHSDGDVAAESPPESRTGDVWIFSVDSDCEYTTARNTSRVIPCASYQPGSDITTTSFVATPSSRVTR